MGASGSLPTEHRAEDSVQRESCVESRGDRVLMLQRLTKLIEHLPSRVMYKELGQGQTCSQIMQAQRDVIKL